VPDDDDELHPPPTTAPVKVHAHASSIEAGGIA
jgi:hypothetical protein